MLYILQSVTHQKIYSASNAVQVWTFQDVVVGSMIRQARIIVLTHPRYIYGGGGIMVVLKSISRYRRVRGIVTVILSKFYATFFSYLVLCGFYFRSLTASHSYLLLH